MKQSISWIIGHIKIQAGKFREIIFSFTFNTSSDHKMQEKVIVRQIYWKKILGATVEVFHENKKWFLSTQKFEPCNKFLTCVEGLPGMDRRLLTSTLHFMLSVQSPLDLNRWKLIQMIKLLQLTETLSASPCCEAGRALGFLHFHLHTLCPLDICTQEAIQIKNFLLERLLFKSPVVSLCITRFNIQKSYLQPTQFI